MVNQKIKTLVLGASPNPQRAAYSAIHQLVQRKLPVAALGIKHGEVAGIPIEQPFKRFETIHTVSIYLSVKLQEAYYDYVIGHHPKRVIFNPGTENPKFTAFLDERQIPWENACTLVLLSTDQYEP